MDTKPKPSFFKSVASFFMGYAKGLLTGAVVGSVTGLLMGAAVGLFTGGVGAAAVMGAVYVGGFMAYLGGISGGVTKVVTDNNATQLTTEDVVKVAKLSFVQGMEVGKNMAQEQSQTKFRDQVTAERAATPEVSQRVH